MKCMGWVIGYDTNWNRDIGYGVPAICDSPRCDEKIDRGLSYVCGGAPYGGDLGCGLYFCSEHFRYDRSPVQLCSRCNWYRSPYNPKPDVDEWIEWKLKDKSWHTWRRDNPEEVQKLKLQITAPNSATKKSETKSEGFG